MPVPDLEVFGESDTSIVLGEVLTPDGEELEINKGRNTLSLSVTNMGDRPIQVGLYARPFSLGSAWVYCCSGLVAQSDGYVFPLPAPTPSGRA